MLVLSRGHNDKVIFPTLGISVEILRVAGNKVRLGIEAPDEIPVHRHEVCERIQADGETDEIIKFPDSASSHLRQLNHNTRNRLNAAALGLHLLHRKLEAGDLSDAEATIFNIFKELKGIEALLDGPAKSEREANVRALHRALVVEDDDNERELLAGYLRMSGFEVDTAADGLQAMVRLSRARPGCRAARYADAPLRRAENCFRYSQQSGFSWLEVVRRQWLRSGRNEPDPGPKRRRSLVFQTARSQNARRRTSRRAANRTHPGISERRSGRPATAGVRARSGGNSTDWDTNRTERTCLLPIGAGAVCRTCPRSAYWLFGRGKNKGGPAHLELARPVGFS